MKETKYTVLMMRDNSPVRRFRMGVGWVRGAVLLGLLLCLLAGVGSWWGVRSQLKISSLSEQLRVEQRQLQNSRMELERLQNVDRILKSNDPEELQTLLSSVTPVVPEEKKEPEPEFDLRALFTHVDLEQVKISNLRAKEKGGNLVCRFNLNNLRTSSGIAGKVSLDLINAKAELVPLGLPTDETDFSIQRFKTFSLSISLPKDLPFDSIFGLRLSITNSSGQILFRETYPLSNILS